MIYEEIPYMRKVSGPEVSSIDSSSNPDSALALSKMSIKSENSPQKLSQPLSLIVWFSRTAL
jgi:hypothetical protein